MDLEEDEEQEEQNVEVPETPKWMIKEIKEAIKNFPWVENFVNVQMCI